MEIKNIKLSSAGQEYLGRLVSALGIPAKEIEYMAIHIGLVQLFKNIDFLLTEHDEDF